METKSVKPRRIIVCLDGTWDTPSERTNVYKFSQVLMDGDVVDSQGNLWEQVHTYFTGLGTSQYRMLGGLFGYGISGQIKSAYKYICKRYRDEKDQIWLLGFSRGAYAVRSLSGMIYNVGLLPPTELSKVEQAYQLYRDQGIHAKPYGMDSVLFREKNRCQMPSIHFLGCFDTVGALGVPKLPWYLGGPIFYNLFHGLHNFHDTKLTPIVKHAYHAISIHDQRAWFSPTLMRFSDKQDLTQPQKLEQVWFPGMHTDVGGQEVAKYSRNIISYHSFRWMMSKASDLGLVFKKDLLQQISDSSSCKYIFQDSYCSAIIYRIMPRVDRVIEKDINTQSYNPAAQLYNGGDFSSFMTQKDMDRYKSKTLFTFYKNAADRKLD
ncbi:hypothetical protein G6F57_009529 [Rhizopus arrhizus]|uniref:T6SS Phospholipase effector Tle1-like catalytic domain-containing protein n=1 Tax=Rhizopus oryzae TaxID=64495 RepID=A0A9P7BPB2_RHIOR|nr:hypothetical protein G6F23_005055 [Rhizopus arrhizus]KAG1422482.1 hypothetical protein G6F58_003277 [Rhizopus delemar]KAG0758839.1 hypothetical protein G6F24_009508 [Rhizopus arrhizus]KAG0782207.1 hypothetical protein G6F21_011239 [Rhizopus arrhizus]KAG0801628.1 hypothetical protein G6F22_001057 [Rhizopus arrhizus]